ncbi:Down syndrome cell adhesion molecule homolog [Centruroides sculpturatus]|uniref:Down syndrome cell adhesion molecule homolog n=1 Tax=Centruroides sculpturatus TaxID=218467 RepID=UPI000C6DF907|nr:Down syndrome cell adhesion molecule homolog [Centruroides sculpturatus]
MIYKVIVKVLVITFSLSVGTGQKIRPFNFPKTVTLGERVTTTCATNSGDDLVYKWYKDGKEIDANKRIQILNYAGASMLVIETAEINDNGNYTCTVNLPSASDSYSAVLKVLVPAQWIKQPSDQDIASGDTVSFLCQASGVPPPNIIWKKVSHLNQNSLETIMTADNIVVSTNGSLIITDIRKTQEGLYRCEVYNGVGEVLSKDISIRVIELYG